MTTSDESNSNSKQSIKIPFYILIVIVVLLLLFCAFCYCICCKPTKNKRKIAAMLKEARLENDAWCNIGLSIMSVDSTSFGYIRLEWIRYSQRSRYNTFDSPHIESLNAWTQQLTVSTVKTFELSPWYMIQLVVYNCIW